jgi:hypothetical protein
MSLMLMLMLMLMLILILSLTFETLRLRRVDGARLGGARGFRHSR